MSLALSSLLAVLVPLAAAGPTSAEASPTSLEDAGPQPAVPSIQAAIVELGRGPVELREAATRQLLEAGLAESPEHGPTSGVVRAVVAAAGRGNLERRSRAVAILEAWAFGPNSQLTAAEALGLVSSEQSDSPDEGRPANPLFPPPSRPSSDEPPAAAAKDDRSPHETPAFATPLAEVAERWLDELSVARIIDPDDPPPVEDQAVAALATAALMTHDAVRRQRACTAIRLLGGRVSFDETLFRSRGLGRGLGRGIGGFAPQMRGGEELSEVVLTPRWSGGTEGLYHLRRLQYVGSFKLRVEGILTGTDPQAILALKQVIDRLEIEPVSTATLGIQASTSTPLVVSDVVPGGACATAGLRGGDTIRRLGDDDVYSLPHVKELLRKYQPHQTVPLTYERYGRRHTVDVTLGDWLDNKLPGRR